MVARIFNALLWITVIACLFTQHSVSAQDYLFKVQRNESHVYIRENGGVDIEYFITFENLGRTIDVVDVGLPNRYYVISTAQADVNGQPVSRIAKSTYIPIGVEVHLGSASIHKGQTKTFHFRIFNDRMIFPDDRDDSYASVEFSPTWFSHKFTRGACHYNIQFHFPPGMTENEPRYHSNKYSRIDKKMGAVVYVWDYPDRKPHIQYKVGASFPDKYVKKVYRITMFQRVKEWAALAFGGIYPKPLLFPIIFPIGIFILFAIVAVVTGYRRKMDYLPPKAKMTGAGVKRGLTAPEAAILLEKPLNKVLTLVLFGLVKKGKLSIASKKPLVMRVNENVPETLRPYEEKFVLAITENGTLDEKDARKLIVKMIEEVQKKCKPYNYRETRKYYEKIVDRAWEYVEQEDLEKGLEWAMLDDRYKDRMNDMYRTRDSVVVPSWWGHYHTGGTTGTTTASGGGSTGGTVSTGQFLNSIGMGFESMTNSIVSNAESFASKVTNVTHPVPVSSGGGGGGGCACACAGCACACAGGGR